MKIETIGAFTKSNVLFSSFIDVAQLQPKTTNDGSPKIHTDGRIIYRTQLKALAVDENGNPTREERNVSVGLLEQTSIQAGIRYALDGLVWITPYSSNGNVGISIVAERIVPVNESPSVELKSLSDQISKVKQ